LTAETIEALTAKAIAKATLRKLKAQSSLLDFIPYTTPQYVAPTHLARYVEALERSTREPVRVVISTPPRHTKSVTTMHFMVQALLRNPKLKIGYATYAQDLSRTQQRLCKAIADLAGLKLTQHSQDAWITQEGGAVYWTSIGGPLTGKGVNLLIIDDPVKGRAEAESKAYRNRAGDWLESDAFTRLEPGASIVVIQTRWHPDDLAGRLIAKGWEVINLQAIDDVSGLALWPDRWPISELQKIREQVGEYTWGSLYQGNPRTKGGRLFGDVCHYDELPRGGYKIYVGIDFAYTAKTHADYSVALTMVAGADGFFYITDVVRKQVDAPTFADRDLVRLRHQYGGGKFQAYIGGTESGVVDFINQRGVNVRKMAAVGDKFSRAQAAAAAWNAGKILVPRRAPWLEEFVSELADFTGIDDPHDDQVDALTSAYADFSGPPRIRLEVA
jgi:predicted phage terminase large subunit-like protein